MFRFLLEKIRSVYKPYGKPCPRCKSTNTHYDAESGIHWCGDCDYEW